MIVEVRGKCFNATLAVQKHVQRCPWCPDPNLQIHHEGQPVSTSLLKKSLTYKKFSGPRNPRLEPHFLQPTP